MGLVCSQGPWFSPMQLPAAESPTMPGVARYMRNERAFLRKRFVKHCTSRFRGNVVDVAADGMAIRCDALSRHDSPCE